MSFASSDNKDRTKPGCPSSAAFCMLKLDMAAERLYLMREVEYAGGESFVQVDRQAVTQVEVDIPQFIRAFSVYLAGELSPSTDSWNA